MSLRRTREAVMNIIDTCEGYTHIFLSWSMCRKYQYSLMDSDWPLNHELFVITPPHSPTKPEGRNSIPYIYKDFIYSLTQYFGKW